jgi:hypothetical protein
MAGGDINVKHLWIQGGGGDPANVSEAVAEYPGQLGKIGTIKPAAGDVPRVLQFVKRRGTDTIAAANYQIAYWSDQDNFEVCADQTNAVGGSTAPVPAGVWLGTYPAAGSYGFVQVAGSWPLQLNSGTTADLGAGQKLFAIGGDADGKVAYAVSGTDATTLVTEVAITRLHQVGVALAAQTVSTETVAALLVVPRNGW